MFAAASAAAGNSWQQSALSWQQSELSWQQSELSAGRCNFQQIDASTLDDDTLLAVLRNATEPTLVRGLLEAGSGHASATRAGFLEAWGSHRVRVTREREFVRTNQADSITEGMELSEFAALLRAPRPADDGALYMVHNLTHADAERFRDGLPPRLRGALAATLAAGLIGDSRVERLSLSGSRGGVFFHVHLALALNVVFAGRKRWFVFHGSDDVMPGSRNDPNWQKTVDEWLGSVYRTAEVQEAWRWRAYECTQHAGEVVAVPPLFAHAIYNLDETLAFVFQGLRGGWRPEFDNPTIVPPSQPLGDLDDDEPQTCEGEPAG